MQTGHFPTIWAPPPPHPFCPPPPMTLNMGSRSPKSNQFLSLSQQYSWSKSIHSFWRQGAEKPFSNNLNHHQNLISYFSCHNNIVVQVWSKSIHSFIRKGADKCRWWGQFSNNLSPCVTLKMGSRSPKSNQFFSMSQQYRCTSLVKIHSFILEIGCRQAIFQQSEPSCDLKMGSP